MNATRNRRWVVTVLAMMTCGVVLAASGAVAPASATEGRDVYLCFGREATIVGTPEADEIYGTANDDVIVGLTGADVIYGLGGNDRICGGGGNDEIRPGPGNDRVKGGAGRDLILGAEGNDLLKGGGGPDEVYGNAGDDRLVGQLGDDYLDGGPGIDVVKGRGGIDTCYGETLISCELPAAVRDFASGTVNIAVSGSHDAVSTITVNSSGTITDLNVGVKITHTWVGDLVVTLTHVNTGTTVTILDQPGTTVYTPPGQACAPNCGCSRDNIDATFDDEASVAAESMCSSTYPAAIYGSVRPNHSLSAFDGEDLGGTWRLTVYDVQTDDNGTLVSWSLHFTA